MKIRFWKVLLFFLAVVAGSWFVFPGPRTLVMLYVQEEKQELARPLLEQLMSQEHNDPDIYLLAADFYQSDGAPDRGIEYLGKALELRPGRIDLLVRLADWLEWADRPEEAINALEQAAERETTENAPKKALEIQKTRRLALTRLLDHYRYQGELNREAWTSVRLLALEKKLKLPELNTDIAVRALTGQMESLAERVTPQMADMRLPALLTELHLARQIYVQDLLENKGGAARTADFIADAMDRFVRSGFLAEATSLAQSLDSSGGQTAARLALVRTLRWYGDDRSALPLLAEIRKQYPGDKEAIQTLVEINSATAGGAVAASTRAAIIADLQQLHDKNPGDKAVSRDLADALIAVDRPKEAYKLLRELPVGTPQEAVALLKAAGATRQSAAVNEAAEAAKPYVKAEKDVAQELAEAWLSADQPARALPMLKEAAAASGNDPALVRKVVEAAASVDDPKALQEALALAERSNLRDPALLLDVAKSLVGNEHLDRAAKVYERYLAHKPEDAAAALQLADVYTWSDQPAQALGVIKKLLQRKPGDKALLTRAATLAEGADRAEDAYGFYAALYKSDPKDAKARANYKRLAADTGHTRELLRLFAEDSDKEPKNFARAREAADAYLNAESPQQAAIYLERALAQKPDDIALRRELASTYGWANMGDRQAATLEPLVAKGLLDEEETAFVAGRLLEKRQAARALAMLQKYEARPDMSWDVGLLLVQAYDADHRADNALKVLRRLQKETKGDPARLSALGDAALGLRRNDLALEFYQAALKRDAKNTSALKGSAQIYAANNDPQKAIRTYESLKTKKPNDIETRYQLGELYSSSDTPEAAYGEYQKALKLIQKARKAQKAAAGAGKGEP